jgi:hypothetical protein
MMTVVLLVLNTRASSGACRHSTAPAVKGLFGLKLLKPITSKFSQIYEVLNID